MKHRWFWHSRFINAIVTWNSKLGDFYGENGMAVRKTKKGAALKRWFKEEWKDVRTGKPCGRKKGEKRGTPYCRPSKRVSKKTPKTSRR